MLHFITPKKILFGSALVLAFLNSNAQNLWSTTPSGNAVFSFNIGTHNVTQHGLLTSVGIDLPTGKPEPIGNGEFIGVTVNAPNTFGAIYKSDTSTNTVTLIYQFTNNDRSVCGFEMANNGKLYTMGQTGTANSYGIYCLDLSNNSYTLVYTIIGNSGPGQPLAPLYKASNGLLYGVTELGGANSLGRLFSFDVSSNTFTSLYDFNLSNGTKPVAALMQGSNGILYGVTAYGGANDKGVIFSYTISTNTYSKLYDFNQPTGESPTSPLYQASNGKFYGTTMAGGGNYQGVLYSFDPNGNVYTVEHNFWATEGYGPRTYPVQASDGLLYGTTNQGGANFRGSIYSYDIMSSTFTKLRDNDDSIVGNLISPWLEFNPGNVGLPEQNTAYRTIKVFPVPCADVLHFTGDASSVEYTITNAAGMVVMSGRSASNSVDVHSLAAGYYILTLRNDSHESRNRFVRE